MRRPRNYPIVISPYHLGIGASIVVHNDPRNPSDIVKFYYYFKKALAPCTIHRSGDGVGGIGKEEMGKLYK